MILICRELWVSEKAEAIDTAAVSTMNTILLGGTAAVSPREIFPLGDTAAVPPRKFVFFRDTAAVSSV